MKTDPNTKGSVAALPEFVRNRVQGAVDLILRSASGLATDLGRLGAPESARRDLETITKATRHFVALAAEVFSNPQAQNYAPLQQLTTDLANNTVARYNWITPDQYNDMHSTLDGGFTYNGVHYTGDQAAIAQGDNFLSIIIPQIEASSAYRNNGAIVVWWDETEGGDDSSRTLGEIIISPDAKGNAYTNNILYTHSSDLVTIQEIYGVGPCLRDACQATDLSDLFKAGSIPQGIPTPEPSTLNAMAAGLVALAFGRYLFRRKCV